MSTEKNQTGESDSSRFKIVLLLIAAVIAWPALLFGAVVRLLIKQRTTNPQPYWILASLLSVVGCLFFYIYGNPYPFLLALFHNVVPLLFHLDNTTLRGFFLELLPLWERSVLLFPLCTLVIELFSPKSLEQTLLAHERQRKARQVQKSKQTARKLRKAPNQINGKGVLGALIEDPNT